MWKRCLAIAMLFGLHGLLTIPWTFWPLEFTPLAALMFALYSLLAFGLAMNVTEAILALCWPRQTLPRMAEAAQRSAAAVVMTVCDDSNEKCLTSLHHLADAGYDVYILDDSASALIPTEELCGRVHHIRRGARTGAKAGNLNNWLATYGDLYEYLLLLDADSIMSVEAADGLLLTAKHPDNSDAAIFQAKIEAADEGSLFAKALSAGARPRMRVMERVHGPLGLMLSFGHNQLLRVRQVIAVGGFDESLTNEDTVISLDLAAVGQRVVLVDVWSTDTEPETASAYIQRTLRWARQTVELFHRPWQAVPLRLKLLLCRHLLAYLLPVVGLSLFGLSLWTGEVTAEHALNFWEASITIKSGYELYGLTLWSILGVSALSWVLRIVLARSEKVPWRLLLLSVAIGKAPYLLMLMPLAGSILASALGFYVRFIPSNSHYARALDSMARGRLLRGLVGGLLIATLTAGALRRPGNLLVGFNMLWMINLWLSPLCLLTLWLAELLNKNSRNSAHRGEFYE